MLALVPRNPGQKVRALDVNFLEIRHREIYQTRALLLECRETLNGLFVQPLGKSGNESHRVADVLRVGN